MLAKSRDLSIGAKVCGRSRTGRKVGKMSFARSVVAAAIGFVAHAAALAGEQSFTLYNQTGVEIDEVYLCPHDAECREEDLLGDNTLPVNENTRIRFVTEDADEWDIRVVSARGDSIIWRELELGESAEVTLYFENGRAWADVE